MKKKEKTVLNDDFILNGRDSVNILLFIMEKGKYYVQKHLCNGSICI